MARKGNKMKKYISPEYTVLCISAEDVMAINSSAYLNMDEATALAFANRYSGDTYDEVDEYVLASIEDLLNLQNGLFIVNASNEKSTDFHSGVIQHHPNTIVSFKPNTFLFPICYPFGIIYFIMEIIRY